MGLAKKVILTAAIVVCLIGGAVLIQMVLPISLFHYGLQYKISDDAGYDVTCLVENGEFCLSSNSLEMQYEVRKADVTGNSITIYLSPVEGALHDAAEIKKVTSRRMIMPNTNHLDSIAGIWEDRVQYEFLAGGRSVEVRFVELYSDGTGQFKMGIGDERTFGEDDEANFIWLYAHELHWQEDESCHYSIIDETGGKTFFLEISELTAY